MTTTTAAIQPHHSNPVFDPTAWPLIDGDTDVSTLATIRGQGAEYTVLSLRDGSCIAVFEADGPALLRWRLVDPEPVRRTYPDMLRAIADLIASEEEG